MPFISVTIATEKSVSDFRLLLISWTLPIFSLIYVLLSTDFPKFLYWKYIPVLNFLHNTIINPKEK